MTAETPSAVLRARITRALDECRTMIPAAQADVVLSVLREATQPEIKAAVLGTTEQADAVEAPTPAPAEELSCTFCKGSGADPEDPGDYDTAVHMHNPYTVGPCPECNGTGRPTPAPAEETTPEAPRARPTPFECEPGNRCNACAVCWS